MIDNIINFPSKNINDWDKISKALHDIIISRGIPENIAIEFLSSFKPTYDTFQFSYEMSFASLNEESLMVIRRELGQFNSALQVHTYKLLFERFSREIDAFYFKNKD